MMKMTTQETAPNNVTKLDALFQEHRECKAVEDRGREGRLRVEGEILEIINTPEEGTLTTTTRFFKCSTTGKLKRKLDAETWAHIQDAVPEALRPVRVKLEIDLKKLRALEQANPEVFRFVAQAIETKPAKAAIKIEVLQ